MSFFCTHEYKLISETVTKSKFETAIKAFDDMGFERPVNLPHQLCHADRKHIQVFTCNKCGKIKRYVENI